MLRLLSVHAHPDDESSKGAGTLAKYAAQGVAVTVVSCTGGESGDILNEQVLQSPHAKRDLPGLRRSEMRAAQELLGIDHLWLGYLDSGLPAEGEPLRPLSFATIPVDVAALPLVRIIRRLRPHVVVTYDEQGGYPHPDHIRTHEITMAAVQLAASEAHPELGERWQTQKVYYDRVISGDRLRALLADYEQHSPNDERAGQMRSWAEHFGDRGTQYTTRIDVRDQFGIRDAALRSHASQVAPDAWFFFWPHEVLERAWPTEEFQLVYSVRAPELPETDLFAGVVEENT